MNVFRENKIIKKVNKMIGWKLPRHAMGACGVCDRDGRIVVYVETSDGGVSAIDYELFLAKAINGKVSKEDYIECLC